MRMMPRRFAAAFLVLGLPTALAAAPLEPLQIVASDGRGVTLRLDLPEPVLRGGDPSQRSLVGLGDLPLSSLEGRPKLPFASALIAVPPGSRVSATVLDAGSETVMDDVRLAIGEKPVFRDDPGGLGLQPWREEVVAIQEIWPTSVVEVSAPFVVRRQHLVRIQVNPCRYDVEQARLSTRRSITVRIAWSAGSSGASVLGGSRAEEDRHWDPVLEQTVLNYEQGRSLREASPSPMARPLFERGTPGRSAAGGPAINAFDDDEPQVRIRIDTTGVYGFDFDALAAAGYPGGVPIAEVSLHRKEYIVNAAVPFETIELPIEVDDLNQNGEFDSGDRIVAFVQTWRARARPSRPQRMWGEAEMVYATRVRSPRAGLRVATRSGWLGQTLVPIGSYPFVRHYERNFDYYNSYNAFADTTVDPYRWMVGALYYVRPESLFFETNDLDTTRAALVTVNLAGRADNSHFSWVQTVNKMNQPTDSRDRTTVMDSVLWFDKVEIVRSATLNGSAFSEGATNSLKIWGKTFNAPPDPTTNSAVNAGLNWFDVSYHRRFRAITDYLDCNSAGQSGDVEVSADVFSDSTQLRVYDVTDSTNTQRLSGVVIEPVGGGYRLRFQDSPAAGTLRRYVVFSAPKTVAPANMTPAIRDRMWNNTAGDYLIVVPEAFRAAVAPLASLRASQGLQVLVTSIESVNDAFNGGRPSAYAIKRYLRYAYLNWNTRFVLLAGDASEDPLRHFPRSGVDWVPTQRIMGPLRAFTGTESFLEGIPSDGWLAWCLDCADPSIAAKVPDLHIGRLPANSVTDLNNMVSKIIAYENAPTDQDWRRDMTLVSDDLYSGESTFGGGSSSSSYCRRSYEDVFRDINNRVRSTVLTDAGLIESEPEVFNISYYLPNQPSDLVPCVQPPSDTCRCDRSAFESRARLTVTPELLSRLNTGRLWWNYQGHANESVLAHESFYRSNGRFAGTDHNSLLNDGKPFFFTAFSCHPNAFAHVDENSLVRGGPSLGEMMMTRPSGRGAIASWGSTGYELLPAIGADHINLALARSMFLKPPRDPYLGEAGARVVLGEAITAALLENFRVKFNNPNERDVAISYVLLGDPATRFSIGVPQARVTANAQPVTSGQIVRLKRGGDTLEVVADVVSNVRLDSLSVTRTDAAGLTTLLPPSAYTVTPALGDTGSASQGGRRYLLTLDDSLRIDSYRYTIRTVDRYGLANPFEILLAFETILFAGGQPVNDLDVISPTAPLTMLVLSPAPIDPQAELALTVAGNAQLFTAIPANGDTTGREWLLSWSNSAFPLGETVVNLTAAGGAQRTHRFRVNVAGAELRIDNPFAFPNPFEDELGVHFSFTLESATPVDLLLRVFTVSGKRIYEQKLTGIQPGYQQIAWNGLDAEGSRLANGMYFYRLVARNATASTYYEGRLAKLRKPERVEDDLTTTP